ncbi:hypothetical protein QUF70_19675, partial [Desulfobacterales bacterium HSG17]|nr:hypothetical protein [Desulfobacterales bacterium HSG17]
YSDYNKYFDKSFYEKDKSSNDKIKSPNPQEEKSDKSPELTSKAQEQIPYVLQLSMNKDGVVPV